MGIISDFAQIDKKFAWSFLGFVLAAIFGGIAIYTEFIRDTSPIIKYEVMTNTKILDVKEDVSGLSVLYNNEDIRKSKKTLSIVSVKISNEGKSAVLKTYYDTIAPLGISIGLGEIIKAEIVDASTNYLQQNALKKQNSQNSIILSDVIIEPSEYFVVKLLVINPENATIAVYPFGKVANVKFPSLINSTSKKSEDPFWRRVIKGSVWVQLTRVPVYFIGSIIFLGLIFGPMVFISERIDKRRRAKIVAQFSSHSKTKYDELNATLYDYYKDNGIYTLNRIREYVSNEDKLNELVDYCENTYPKNAPNEIEADKINEQIMHDLHRDVRRGIKRPVILRLLGSLGLIIKDGKQYRPNDLKINAMNEFIDFVTIKEA